MADERRMAPQALLRKTARVPGAVGEEGSEHSAPLRDGMRVLAQALMETKVSQHVGAERYERSADRTGERNGYRQRPWDTRVGSIDLRVPRVRDGSYFPALLEPRRRAERALAAVVQEAYVQGVSTRRVDEVVKALGMDGISKSQVSRICVALDEEVERFRTRPLVGPYPYVWLDATFVKVRQDHRISSVAIVLAVGVRASGEREVLGLDVGPSEDGAFWLTFLRTLVARGLSGVQLVTSDSHQGLKAAVAATLHGAAWQRCRTHFMRNALCLVPKHAQQMAAAAIRLVFFQPDPASARDAWRQTADGFRTRFSKLAQLLDDAEEDVLAYLAFPREHWRQIRRNNPLERRWSGSTKRSSVAPMSSGSFRTLPLSSAWSGRSLPAKPNSMTSGRSAAASCGLNLSRRYWPRALTPRSPPRFPSQRC